MLRHGRIHNDRLGDAMGRTGLNLMPHKFLVSDVQHRVLQRPSAIDDATAQDPLGGCERDMFGSHFGGFNSCPDTAR